jgi:hypothetical protein
MIVQNDPIEGNQIKHCIRWDEDTDPSEIGKAIENVIDEVKRQSLCKKKVNSSVVNTNLVRDARQVIRS